VQRDRGRDVSDGQREQQRIEPELVRDGVLAQLEPVQRSRRAHPDGDHRDDEPRLDHGRDRGGAQEEHRASRHHHQDDEQRARQ
jgi:hypothetical protein